MEEKDTYSLETVIKTISMYIEYLDSYLEELISKSNGKS